MITAFVAIVDQTRIAANKARRAEQRMHIVCSHDSVGGHGEIGGFGMQNCDHHIRRLCAATSAFPMRAIVSHGD